MAQRAAAPKNDWYPKLRIFSSSPFSSSRERDVKVSTSTTTNTAGASGDDFSDVVRRVAGDASSSLRNGKGAFEIYVDPKMDPDIGEILVVHKRPSKIRGGLGVLGEVRMSMSRPFRSPLG